MTDSPGLLITERRRSLVGSVLVVEAQTDVAVAFGSVLGDRVFAARAGDVLVVRCRRQTPGVGTRIRMSHLVGYAMQWTSLPWRWA